MSGSIQRVKWRTTVQIASRAQLIRTELGWSDGPCGDLLQALESRSCSVSRGLEIFVLPDDEMHAPAEYHDGCRQIHLRNSVAERAYDGDGYARWTVGHELGHATLHRGELTYPSQRSATSFRRLFFVSACENSEWQADEFSKHLLMPTHLCVKMQSADEIQEICGVSKKAAKIRFDELVQLRKTLNV